MDEFRIILLLNLSTGSLLAWWVWRSPMPGNRRIMYFLCFSLPFPTLVYLLVLRQFTNQLYRKGRVQPFRRQVSNNSPHGKGSL